MEYPELIHEVRFYGYLNDIPAEYYLDFNHEGNLIEILISPSELKGENKDSNYMIILAYLGKTLGIPIDSETDDYTEFSSEDGGAILEDTCYWEYKGSKYKMRIETLIERSSGDDEPYKGDFYQNVSLVITPIDE